MPSVFDDLFLGGFNHLTDVLGETVVYTPYNNAAAGTPVTFTAPFAELEGGNFDRAGFREKSPRTAVLEAPITINGSPQTYVLDGTFLILGTLWKVDKFATRDAAQQTIHLKATGTDQKLDRI